MRAANAIPLGASLRAPLLHGEQGGLLMRLCGRRFDKHVAAVGISLRPVRFFEDLS